MEGATGNPIPVIREYSGVFAGEGIRASWDTLTVQEMQGLGAGVLCWPAFYLTPPAVPGLLNWITPAADATSPDNSDYEI